MTARGGVRAGRGMRLIPLVLGAAIAAALAACGAVTPGTGATSVPPAAELPSVAEPSETSAPDLPEPSASSSSEQSTRPTTDAARPSPEPTQTVHASQSHEVPAPSASDVPSSAGPATGAPPTAASVLAELQVKGRAPKTGYDRDRFRYRSIDLDRNGCDTRNDILARDLRDVSVEPGTGGCVVLAGTLDDPFSALRIAFTRGTTSSSAVQIDHVVALSDAWQKGAQAWDDSTLAAFGNDPLNLLAVDGPLNSQKGDGDAATWLPPNKAFRCQYVARQIAVKRSYDLWVTSSEKDAMTRVLAACPGEPLPTAGTVATVAVTGDKLATTTTQKTAKPKAARPKPKAKPTATSEKPATTDRDFGTCKEAKSHGYGPYVAGVDPEYHFYRDADKDGVVCE